MLELTMYDKDGNVTEDVARAVRFVYRAKDRVCIGVDHRGKIHYRYEDD